MNSLIPTPKVAATRAGTFRVPVGDPVQLRIHGDDTASVRKWLTDCLTHDLRVTVSAGPSDADAAIHLGLIDHLADAGLADESWRSSRAFEAPVGREQGYVLEITPGSVVVAALAAQGLFYGAASLLQLLQVQDGALLAPCSRIEDWPDFRFRAAADWLLNAEINRWGYERGDGRHAVLARMKRKLDLAARHKVNVVWFDGFGWDPDRAPGYAEFVRELTDFASERHVRLAHAGYGGGYGFAYQKSQLYSAPYQGQTFENRTSYPDGEVYDCVGHTGHAVSRRYGTCLSNAALAELKLAELARFVRECRPGMLYIHDIDSGYFEQARKGWMLRCDQCRERWPDDEMVSAQGAAAAYGSWFRQVAEAINAVESDDGQYLARRDCEILFVGPMYTSYSESDELWLKDCDYLALASETVGPSPNVQFGIREQFVSDEPPGLRAEMLQRRLDEVGNGHGVFVIAFVGGDNYYNSQLVSIAPALHPYYLGAETIYTVTFGSVVEPAQLVNAEYAWNANAPGAFEVADTRDDVLELLERCRAGEEQKDDVFGRDGILSRACDRLYGPQAGPILARLFSLGIGTGVSPVLTGWGSVTRHVGSLLKGQADGAEEHRTEWEQKQELTVEALSLAEAALAEPLPDADTQADIEWLRVRLEVGRRLCRTIAACWEWRREPTDSAQEEALKTLDDLDGFLSASVPTDTTDPVGGDVRIWQETVGKLRSMCEAQEG